MTAEMAVLNKNAVALAADSAVTVSTTRGHRVYNTANKLFALSKFEPVGIMIHNAAELVGVPWELLVKLYRRAVGEQALGSVGEWVDDFIGFLDEGNQCFPDNVQRQYFYELCTREYSSLKAKALDEIANLMQGGASITEDDVKRLVSTVVTMRFDELSSAAELPHLPRSQATTILRSYGEIASSARQEVFEALPLTSAASNKLRRVPALLLTRDYVKDDFTGVVIAGYGRDEVYPALQEITVDGLAVDRVKFARRDALQVTAENTAIVIPFAQHEMVNTFMEGINPYYEDVLDTALTELFADHGSIVADSMELEPAIRESVREALDRANAGMLAALSDHMRNYRHREYVNPVVETVAALSKEELAEMAESLVSLTSFRRRVSQPLETVGGPIDVAVISKGDGLIWMQRKHYFDAALNPHFFSNYYRDDRLGGGHNDQP